MKTRTVWLFARPILLSEIEDSAMLTAAMADAQEDQECLTPSQ